MTKHKYKVLQDAWDFYAKVKALRQTPAVKDELSIVPGTALLVVGFISFTLIVVGLS